MFQCGFRTYHSTETELVKVVNDMRLDLDSKKITVLVLLDIGAASDKVDHPTLPKRLENIALSGSDGLVTIFRYTFKLCLHSIILNKLSF